MTMFLNATLRLLSKLLPPRSANAQICDLLMDRERTWHEEFLAAAADHETAWYYERRQWQD